MPTTIQISNEIRKRLEAMKLFSKESYNDVIERILEDEQELNEKTRREIEEASKKIKAGEYFSQAEMEKQFGV